MKISLITSLYRSDKHISKWQRQAISMAKTLEKTRADFELIVIANDPTEKESAILETMSALPWFKLVKVPRESLYASWNRGVENSTGDAIGFWNVDDIRFAGGLLDGAARIEAGADLVYFPFIYKRYIRIFAIKLLAKVKMFSPPEFDKERFSQAMHCGPFFMFSRDFFKKVGEFDESYKIAGDYEWCARAAQIGKFDRSDKVGGIFTNDGTTLSGSRTSLQQEENDRVLKAIKPSGN